MSVMKRVGVSLLGGSRLILAGLLVWIVVPVALLLCVFVPYDRVDKLMQFADDWLDVLTELVGMAFPSFVADAAIAVVRSAAEEIGTPGR